MKYHSWRMLSYCTREKGCEATWGWTPAVTLLWVSARLLLSPSPTVCTLGVHAAPQCLIFGWALCSLSVREMGGWGQKECVQTLRYLTQLFFSSPTEKEAAKFFSGRNGCGQVPVVFALRWMKKLLNVTVWSWVLLCWGFAWEEKLILRSELHFQCTEFSLYSKIMLFLKQVAKCKYH